MAVDSSIATVPAMAVMSATGVLERSTEPFRERCGTCPDTLPEDTRFLSIIKGQLDHASLTLEGRQLEVEAVSDLHGKRQALLTLPGQGTEAPLTPAANALLAERFDDSPAIVWMKDLEGRYLHANRCYAETLSTSEERLLGRTDNELPAREVVDGPRLQHGPPMSGEPLALEYTIEPFEGRPALTVLRFAVLDREGNPVAVCGVAAPMAQAHLARAEGARLVRMERWSRLDPDTVKGELLDEWGLVRDAAPAHPALQPAPGEPQRHSEPPVVIADPTGHLAPGPPTASDDRAAGEIERMRTELAAATSRAEAAEAELASLRARGEGPVVSAPVATAPAAQAPAPAAGARRWPPSAQRALTAALVSAPDWRSGLEDAIKLLGSAGGWAAVTAWCPAEQSAVRCVAAWAAEDDYRGPSDALAQRRPVRVAGSELLRSMGALAPIPLPDLEATGDDRLRTVAAAGMRSGLLVPVRDGVRALGVIEFLSREAQAPDPDLVIALEAVGLQIGHFGHLRRLGARPHWRVDAP